MAEPEVMPCPFCGKRNWQANLEPGESAWLECASCGATGPVALGPQSNPPRTAAIEAWNTRASAAGVKEVPRG